MKPPFTVKEEDFKGPAYRLNRLVKLLCANIPDTPVEAPRPGSSHTASTDLVLFGTHADRVALTPPASHLGAIYVETDRGNVVYQVQYVANVPTWIFLSGIYQRTQAQLAALAATLGTDDTGFRAWVTTYHHTLYWTGSAWAFPVEDAGGGFIQPFVVPPLSGGWILCDGAATDYLKGDGTLANFTTPDLTSAANKAAYLKLAGTVAGPNAATAPGATSSTIAQTLTAGTGTAAGGVVVAANAHTHPAPTITVDATGEPRNYVLLPYFRR